MYGYTTTSQQVLLPNTAEHGKRMKILSASDCIVSFRSASRVLSKTIEKSVSFIVVDHDNGGLSKYML